MKPLTTLLKIEQKKLDQLLLNKKELLILLDQTNLKLKEHIEQVRVEKERYINSQYNIFLENFIKASKEYFSHLNNKIAEIENNIQVIEEEILGLFTEMKRYEIIIQNNKKLIQKKNMEYENKALDELTIIKLNHLEKT